MTIEPYLVSKAEFARACNVTPGRVNQWIGEGRIRKHSIVGEGWHARINLLKAKADLGSDPDIASTGNAAGDRTHPTEDTKAASTVSSVPFDPLPDPARYRQRADLPDDFARGALYGMHAVLYDVPSNFADGLADRGLPIEDVMSAYHADRQAADCYMVSPLESIGLLSKNSERAGRFSPTAFAGFNYYLKP